MKYLSVNFCYYKQDFFPSYDKCTQHFYSCLTGGAKFLYFTFSFYIPYTITAIPWRWYNENLWTPYFCTTSTIHVHKIRWNFFWYDLKHDSMESVCMINYFRFFFLLLSMLMIDFFSLDFLIFLIFTLNFLSLKNISSNNLNIREIS